MENLLSQLQEMKNNSDEQIDETITKVNELDARISMIEEKEMKSIVVTEEDKEVLDHDEVQAL